MNYEENSELKITPNSEEELLIGFKEFYYKKHNKDSLRLYDWRKSIKSNILQKYVKNRISNINF